MTHDFTRKRVKYLLACRQGRVAVNWFGLLCLGLTRKRVWCIIRVEGVRAGVRKIGRGSDMGVNILFGLVFGVWEISVFEEMLCQLKP